MANFAIIANGIVENIIVADSKELAEIVTGKNCVEYSEENLAHIGYGFNSDTNTFETPPVIEQQGEEIV